MPELPPVDYQTPSPRPRRAGIALCVTFLIAIPPLIWALHELAIMPYRPPMDMTTFLGGPEEAFVSMLMTTLAIAWIIALICCVALLRRNKRAA